MNQASAKKLLDGLISFAKELGFTPHPDYKNAYELFGDIEASSSPVKYTYCRDGRPFYMNGPYESANNILRILKTLTKICGAGGFDNLHKLDDGMDDEFMWFHFLL